LIVGDDVENKQTIDFIKRQNRVQNNTKKILALGNKKFNILFSKRGFP